MVRKSIVVAVAFAIATTGCGNTTGGGSADKTSTQLSNTTTSSSTRPPSDQGELDNDISRSGSSVSAALVESGMSSYDLSRAELDCLAGPFHDGESSSLVKWSESGNPDDLDPDDRSLLNVAVERCLGIERAAFALLDKTVAESDTRGTIELATSGRQCFVDSVAAKGSTWSESVKRFNGPEGLVALASQILTCQADSGTTDQLAKAFGRSDIADKKQCVIDGVAKDFGKAEVGEVLLRAASVDSGDELDFVMGDCGLFE